MHIAAASGAVYDVSADISTAQISRNEGISTVSLTLTNASRKYDGVFAPMDRIVVYLTRTKRLLILSGYLDSVPLFTTFPVSISLRASCTLKRLQQFLWDPHSSASVKVNGPMPGDASKITDGGIADRIRKILTTIVRWPDSKIHIGSVPVKWFDQVSKVADTLVQQSEIASMISTVGIGSMGGFGPGTVTGMDLKIPGIGTGTGTIPGGTGYGLCSKFGGPHGGAYDGMAITGEPGGLPDNQRAKWGGPYYCAMRWGYATWNGHFPVPTPGAVGGAVGWWGKQKILVTNPATHKAVCVRPADWGPGIDTRIIDLSETAMAAIAPTGGSGNITDLPVYVCFAPSSTPLGPVSTASTQSNSVGGALAGTTGADKAGKNTALKFLAAAVETITTGHPGYYLGASASMTDPYPRLFDCSELVQWADFRTSGTSRMSGTAFTQYQGCKHISVAQATKIKGALLFMTDSMNNLNNSSVHHVAISQGDGTTIEARSTDKGCGSWPVAGSGFNLAGLIQGMDYTGAGGSGTGGVGAGGVVAGGAAASPPGSDPAAPDLNSQIGDALYNAFQQLGDQSTDGDLLYGVRALMNDVPIYPTIDDLMNSGLRQWCSAPNGDIIGWFPDYFGHWGTAAKMIIEDVEIEQPFTVDWSDDRLKTHMFVTGATTGQESFGDATQIYEQSKTAGIASVEMPELMSALFNVPVKQFADKGVAFLRRYGARTDNFPMDIITGPRQEFFFACFRFMQNWTQQYACNVSMTFMPELYPGMLAVFPRYGVQAYVNTVSHSIDMGNGGGFTTQVGLSAWSTIGHQPSIKGLPIGASL